MTDTDKNAFADSLTALGMIFGVPVEKALLAAYWLFLRDLDLTVFSAAVAAAGRTLKWFPKPAELLDLAGAGETARKAARVAAIAAAWEAVRGAMDRYDYTHSVDFGPVVNAVIRNMGGWRDLCGRSLRDLTFDRKKFEELLDVYLLCPPRELRGEPLRGQFGGEPVRIAIAGKMPPRQIDVVATSDHSVVRHLFDRPKT